ncbi:SIMPL domain-containing protein [Paenibacillus sp. GCM10027627]|uniref:SIMPL domain-containing protein n=1 Tax=unclassified Paenibacillus TaxID=185978 RepID=UPI00362AA409
MSFSGDHQKQAPCDFTIEVIGEGSVAAIPDRTAITVGVVTEGAEVQPVQAENAKTAASIIEALLKLGIPREQIQTKLYSIDPQYDYVDGKQTFRGYRSTHLLGVTLSGTDQAGLVIDTAVASGANSVSDITFAASNEALLQGEALSAAVRNAAAKAKSIADAMGVALSSVPCQVQEISQDGAPIRFKAAMAAGDFGSPVEPGQLTFKAAVRVVYMFA